jgi:hypothetical protein
MSCRLGSARDVVEQYLDPETFKGVGEIWGLDDEGEFRGVWGGFGPPNLWFLMGKPHYPRFICSSESNLPFPR